MGVGKKPGKKRENRQGEVLRAAAKLIKDGGYDETSMRDIAAEVGMLPGSIYYHFPSKEDLLLAVYRVGIDYLLESSRQAMADLNDPWDRLRAVCINHTKTILTGNDSAGVAVCILPRNDLQPYDQLFDKLGALRDEYEDVFRQLIAELPLRAGVSRKFLRLAILGALNYAAIWYNPGGDDPTQIADRILSRFAEGEGVVA